MRKRRRLAAPFLVTFAASACNNGGAASGANADAASSAAVTASVTAPADTGAGGASSAASGAGATATDAPEGGRKLPAAPAFGRIERLDGGACMWRAPAPSLSSRIRNPPAPHLVECPDADAP